MIDDLNRKKEIRDYKIQTVRRNKYLKLFKLLHGFSRVLVLQQSIKSSYKSKLKLNL